MISSGLLIFFGIVVESVLSLRMEDANEGSCQGISTQPVPMNDLSFLDRLTYIAAANRLNYYIVASQQPSFDQMQESELINSLCLEHNAQKSKPIADYSAFGFGGQVLGNLTSRAMKNQKGLFFVGLNSDPREQGAFFAAKTQSVTLTDHKTFAFITQCWIIDGMYKSWEVVSLTPQLSRSTKRAIENHAASLGFERRHFMFLDYSNCENRNNESLKGGWSSPVNNRFQQKQ